MKKTIWPIFLILIMTFVLAGCGGNQPVSNNSSVDAAGNNSAEMANNSSDSVNTEDTEDNAGGIDVDETETDVVYWDQFSAPVTAKGSVIIIYGQVMDANAYPQQGVAVEFWQTDEAGVYDHPGDSGTTSRDLGFQFYGTAVTDSEGQYAFRTIRPGRYEPRPPHIHVKVKLEGKELLTTQIYFADVGAEGGVGAGADDLLLTTTETVIQSGETVLVGEFNFVVDLGSGSGTLQLTPSQGEGPYYPVVDVSQFDNDLVSVED